MAQTEDRDHDGAIHHITYGRERFEAFSDGVFAIAITLLIIEVGVPHVEEGQSLWRALGDQWAQYLGYGLSFLIIGIMWANHHSLFRDIRHLDHTLIVLNLFLLATTAFLPFSTALLAEYIEQSDRAHAETATIVYGITVTVNAVFWNLIWWYARYVHPMLAEHVSEQRARARTVRYGSGLLLYAATIPLAFVSPWISIGVYFALAAVFLLPQQE